MVHSREDYDMAIEASNILFGRATKESLVRLDEATLLAVFDGVPRFEVAKDQVCGAKAVDRLVTADNLLDGKYLLVQRGKKNYFLIIVK